MEATNWKQALDLSPGDVVPPPRQERGWMWRDGVKRMLTVTGVAEGRSDRVGPWVVVSATFESPYADAAGARRTSAMKFKVRPTTSLQVQVP